MTPARADSARQFSIVADAGGILERDALPSRVCSFLDEFNPCDDRVSSSIAQLPIDQDHFLRFWRFNLVALKRLIVS
jgi:hypothetical protein